MSFAAQYTVNGDKVGIFGGEINHFGCGRVDKGLVPIPHMPLLKFTARKIGVTSMDRIVGRKVKAAAA